MRPIERFDRGNGKNSRRCCERRERRPDREDFFVAISRDDRDIRSTLVAEDIEWIIPGSDRPLYRSAPQARWSGGRISDGLRGGADDHFVFATAVLDGKITNIPEYIDTQARAAQRNASAPAQRRP
jgi:ketosteroid isomerase-like protein